MATGAVERDGYRLFQKGVYYCAHDNGNSFEQILRIYLDPHLEFVDPGRHDVVGDHLGDATALAPVADGELAARLYPGVGRASHIGGCRGRGAGGRGRAHRPGIGGHEPGRAG